MKEIANINIYILIEYVYVDIRKLYKAIYNIVFLYNVYVNLTHAETCVDS